MVAMQTLFLSFQLQLYLFCYNSIYLFDDIIFYLFSSLLHIQLTLSILSVCQCVCAMYVFIFSIFLSSYLFSYLLYISPYLPFVQVVGQCAVYVCIFFYLSFQLSLKYLNLCILCEGFVCGGFSHIYLSIFLAISFIIYIIYLSYLTMCVRVQWMFSFSIYLIYLSIYLCYISHPP